jgi:hypothetical protein
MYYKNKNWHHIMTNKTTITTSAIKSRILPFLLVTVILSSIAFGNISAISTMHRVDAKMSNTNVMAGTMMMNSSSTSSGSRGSSMDMGSNMMAIPAKAPVLNITTAAPPVTPAMFKSMASQIRIDLPNATMIAEKWAGSNSHAISSMIGMQNGSPVYTIWVIDSDSGLHQIVVDPQDGKVLFANQPMSMSGPFS